MIALRRGATELNHEDYMEGILEVQAKKKANLQYYAWAKGWHSVSVCVLAFVRMCVNMNMFAWVEGGRCVKQPGITCIELITGPGIDIL